jgi:hypothetical protein
MLRSGHHRASEHVVRHRRMSRPQRIWVYAIVGTLWLTGIVWFFLDEFGATRGEFGVTPHPLEAPLLLLHGILAILSMYLFGWIVARHVSRWWAARQRRLSGGLLTGLLALLSVSGFALFFLVNDRSLQIATVIHDALGLAAVIFAVQHWFLRGRRMQPTHGPKKRI